MPRLLLLAALLAAPLVHAQTRVAPGGLAGSETRFTLDADGDRLVIGVPEVDGGRGAVYIAERTGDPAQPWRIGVRVVRSQGAAGDAFGSGVHLVGDDLFVSAPGVRIPNPQGVLIPTGEILHFRFNTGVQAWLQQATIGPDDIQRLFGTEIAYGGGGFLAVRDGTRGDAVYVFEQIDASTWTRAATLDAPVTNSNFGTTLAMDDSTLVVGAPFAGDGQAYVYDYDDGADTWGLTATFSRGGVSTPVSVPRTRGLASQFGSAVAIDGSRIAVGAPVDFDNDLNTFTGSVVTFARNEVGAWARTAALYGSGGTSNGRLGESVAIEGLRVVAGAVAEGDGAVYVFDGAVNPDNGAVTWSETDRRTQPTGTPGRFGSAVATAARAPVGLAPQDRAAFVFDDLAVSTDARPEADLRLSAPTPNPASGAATLALVLDAPQRVRATLHDVLGRTVATVHDGPASGTLALAVEAGRLAPGLYLVRVAGERFAATQTLTVVR
ncbi:MAG: hypothetical protein AAF845_02950 [Bacteroidota bacterium]